MDFVTVLMAAFGILSAVAINMLSNELYLKLLPFGRWIIQRAVSILPCQIRAPLEEEWLAHYAETEGNISKVMHAFGCIEAAFIIRDDFEQLNQRPLESKSFVYKAITQLYYHRECAIAASLFFILPLFLVVYAITSIYRIVFDIKAQLSGLDYLMELYFMRRFDAKDKYYERRYGRRDFM
jgi:hypothetical protein